MSLVVGAAFLMALPWACDDTPANEPTGPGGPGSGPGAGGSGTGGAGAVCGDDCPVLCDIPPTPGSGDCIGVGDAPFECNPVTNSPCTGGKVCDFGPGGFRCYAGNNTRKACEPCNSSDHCAAGLTCSTFSVCAKFCCQDSDCGSQGKCEVLPPLAVGTCVKGAGGPGPSSGPGPGPSSAESSAASTGNGGAGASGGMGGGGPASSAASSAVSSAASSSAASTGAGGMGGN